VLLRYPGAKSRGALKEAIIDKLTGVVASNPEAEFREPFFGSGSVGPILIEYGVKQVWFNDRDPGISASFKDSLGVGFIGKQLSQFK
jgi:hypothetical protein